MRVDLPESVRLALYMLEQAGFPAYLVGGCVRDGLRGRTPHDWDMCTAARPEAVHAVLSGAFSVRDTGLAHGTVTAVREDLRIEVTTYRVEGTYADGRRPDKVAFVGDIREDLARRDFTVGAIAYAPTRGLYDPFNGCEDLNVGVLRCVGDPDARFAEDALRIARGLRLSAEYGFRIEAGTLAAMHRQMHRLNQIACERIYVELTRLLCGAYAERVLRSGRNILAQMLPELRPMFDLAQQNKHHKYDVWEHTVRTVGQAPVVPLLRWTMLLHDSGKPACKTVDEQGVGHFRGHPKVSRAIAEQIALRLRFSVAERDALLLLVEHHDTPLADTPALLRRRLSQYGLARVRDLLAIKKADVIGQGTNTANVASLAEQERLLCAVLRQQQCFSLRQLAVSGHDLLAIGLRGKAVGQMLDALLHHVLEHPQDNDRQALLTLAYSLRTGRETT